jgi:hypothetical protein
MKNQKQFPIGKKSAEKEQELKQHKKIILPQVNRNPIQGIE